jgi:hypothetical protein
MTPSLMAPNLHPQFPLTPCNGPNPIPRPTATALWHPHSRPADPCHFPSSRLEFKEFKATAQATAQAMAQKLIQP